jgi:hypothetical protein
MSLARRLLGLVLLIGICASLLSLAPTISAATLPEEAVVGRISTRDRAEVEQLVAMGLDLLEFRRGDDVFIVSTPSEIVHLRADGWQIVVDQEQTAFLRRDYAQQGDIGISSFNGGYRNAAEIEATLRDRAARYPNLAEFFVYGRSWKGAPLVGVKLTNRHLSGPKPTFFLMAAIHAREITTPEVALRFVDELLTHYGIDADATWLLDEHQIVVVPLANPDGYTVAAQGYYQRKNLNTSYGGACAQPPTANSQYGVDLNRNFNFKWGTIDKPTLSPCSIVYPGPRAESEPETVALQSLLHSLFPDQRGPNDGDAAPPDAMGMFASLHAYGDLVIWPWAYTSSPAPNHADLALLGGKLASYNGYTSKQANTMYPMSSTTTEWSYGVLGIASYTFEIGPSSGECGGFMPPFRCMDGGSGGSFWERNRPALFVRCPYRPRTVHASAWPCARKRVDQRGYAYGGAR